MSVKCKLVDGKVEGFITSQPILRKEFGKRCALSKGFVNFDISSLFSCKKHIDTSNIMGLKDFILSLTPKAMNRTI